MTIGIPGIEEEKFQKLTSSCGAARAATPHSRDDWRASRARRPTAGGPGAGTGAGGEGTPRAYGLGP